MKQVCVAGKVRYWAVPEKIHTPPTEEISAVRRGRGEKMVSDNHRRRKIVKWGGTIFIYSCSALVIYFEIDCFYGL